MIQKLNTYHQEARWQTSALQQANLGATRQLVSKKKKQSGIGLLYLESLQKLRANTYAKARRFILKDSYRLANGKTKAAKTVTPLRL